jgi:hypothetical protein
VGHPKIGRAGPEPRAVAVCGDRRPRAPHRHPEVLPVADSKEYYSFEEVMKDLALEESELKRLVSAGEIRAFRDKNTMRFKAEDVARLKTTRPEDDTGLDDLELDLDDAAASHVEPALSDELVLEDTTVETTADVVELDLAAEPSEVSTARTRVVREAAPRRARAVVVEEVEPKDNPLVVIALIVGVALLLVANFVVFDAVTGVQSNPLSAAVANMFG